MNDMFSIAGKVAVITGAGGVLGGSISRHFVEQGAKVVALDIRQEQLDARVEELKALGGVDTKGYVANVLDIPSIKNVADQIMKDFGKVDILLNIAGGNVPGATLEPDQPFWEMDIPKWDFVTNLNLNGTVYMCVVFTEIMAKQGFGSIINISSMNAYRPLTRIPGYSAAKSAVTNFTQWLAAECALKYGDKIRVNSIAPGFFIGDQNRKMLMNPDGSLTERSQKIINNTPFRRFGDINELNGAVQFLCSDASSFITGINLAVDGGFSNFSGV
ncbi:MAG: SDR family oxidoreductase [Bacteroidales bacterium]|nr:SDR family oxidoreductase [Bacteroidales bacterium]